MLENCLLNPSHACLKPHQVIKSQTAWPVSPMLKKCTNCHFQLIYIHKKEYVTKLPVTGKSNKAGFILCQRAHKEASLKTFPMIEKWIDRDQFYLFHSAVHSEFPNLIGQKVLI